jgi:CRISPR-associated protein Cas2
MVVIVLERVATSLRGELSRWMLEIRAGTFVGRVSAMVRDKLWDMVCEKSREGGCVMVYKTNNEQGFAFRLCGRISREVVDFDGMKLVRIPKNQ